MKAVVLEDYAIQQGDLDWSGVKALVPDITRYGRTAQEEVVPRIEDAEIVFLNKCRIDEAVLAQCPKLRWVGIIATGTDNLDLKACRRHGVPVANVPGYSTYSVAQMTFSLLLAICQCADRYHRLVQDGHWRTEEPAAYGLLPQVELLGKTFGIYGYGSIGRQTARIAKAFGMEVLVCTRTVRPEYEADGVEFVDLDTLLARSDVLSLHCPATPATRGLINAATLAKAKPGMILLNTARGEEYDKLAGLESGADDYVVKPFSPRELVARVKAVLNRTMPKPAAASDTMTFGELTIDTASHTVRVSGEEVALTPKEFDLLVFLASNKGIALSREKILQKGWNYDYFGEDRTVDTHVKMLRGHLGKCRSYIATVWGIGYKFDPDATR